jgi:hypothetical protein
MHTKINIASLEPNTPRAIIDLDVHIMIINKHKSGIDISSSPKIMINSVKVYLGII